MKRKMGKGLTIMITMSMIVCGIPFPQGQTNEGKRADVVKAETKRQRSVQSMPILVPGKSIRLPAYMMQSISQMKTSKIRM